MYKIFLQEGKKEDSIKRVKEMFPDDSDFIDKIFDETAKLGAKYIPFVETETKRFLIDPFTDFDVFISGLIRQIEFFNKNSNKNRNKKGITNTKPIGGARCKHHLSSNP